MNIRKYKTNPEELIQDCNDALAIYADDADYIIKIIAVKSVASGNKVSNVAELLAVSKVAVTGWVKTADEEGIDALRPKQRRGKQPKLNVEQLKAIDKVLQSDPKELGYRVWDGPTLSSHIKATYGIDLGVRQCQRLFHKLGFSHIRPQAYPSKGFEDTEERKAFKKN